MWPNPRVLGSLALCVLLMGCTAKRSDSLRLPELSPEHAAQQALQQYDLNKDGQLDARELEKCPALQQVLKSSDKDQNAKLAQEEIADRLKSYTTARTAMLGMTCQVMMDNEVLSGAQVTFVPEKFLGEAFRPATGVTDEDGSVTPQTEGVDIPGLYCGLYRIQISKRDAQGKETIPARFNLQTTLGQEIAPDTRDVNIFVRVSRR